MKYLVLLLLACNTILANDFLLAEIQSKEFSIVGITLQLKTKNGDMNFFTEQMPQTLSKQEVKTKLFLRLDFLKKQRIRIEKDYENYPKTIVLTISPSNIDPVDRTINYWIEYETKRAKNESKQRKLKETIEQLQKQSGDLIFMEHKEEQNEDGGHEIVALYLLKSSANIERNFSLDQ